MSKISRYSKSIAMYRKIWYFLDHTILYDIMYCTYRTIYRYRKRYIDIFDISSHRYYRLLLI